MWGNVLTGVHFDHFWQLCEPSQSRLEGGRKRNNDTTNKNFMSTAVYLKVQRRMVRDSIERQTHNFFTELEFKKKRLQALNSLCDIVDGPTQF